jgi:hypothetical protein
LRRRGGHYQCRGHAGGRQKPGNPTRHRSSPDTTNPGSYGRFMT